MKFAWTAPSVRGTTSDGMPDGAAFTDAIKRSSMSHHGHAGRQFLERLTQDTRDFEAMRKVIAASKGLSARGLSGQERRAAARFALIAMAGELATEYGITGWPARAATEAAATAFRLWREGRAGPGQSEPRRIVQAVIDFIDKHGDSRFEPLGGVCRQHPDHPRPGGVATEGKRSAANTGSRQAA